MGDWTLSPLDISFLSMESAAIPMTIGAVALLDPPAGAGPSLAELLRERAARIPRLRRRLRADWFPPMGASWVADPDFDPAAHVCSDRAVGAGGSAELNAWVARTMMRRLPRERPLWEIHLLDGLAGQRTGMLLKVHHAFLDGIGAGALASALADGGSPTYVPGPAAAPAGTGPSEAVRRLLGPLADPPALARASAHAMSTLTGVLTTMTDPGPGFPFDTVVSPARAFATTSVAVAEIRGLRAVCGGTVNDIGIALLAGAIRSWLIARHYPADELRLRALVPVSGRRASGGSGNAFSAYLLDLPVHVDDPLDRLQFVAERMRRHRGAGAEGGAGALANLTNLLPPAAVRLGGPVLANAASRVFDLLVTTVPVPRPLRIADRAVREIYPLTPLGPNQPLALGASSYGGRLHIGVTADPIVVPDPAALAAAVPAELAVLRTAAGLRPPVPVG